MTLVIAALGLAGCYRYTPATTTAASAGTTVRLQLTPAGAERLSAILGGGTVAVEGTILGANDTAYVLSISGTRKRDEPRPITWAGEQVTIPRAAVERIETRQLDKRRTLTAVGAALLGAVAVKLIVGGVRGSAGGDDGSGTPPPPP